MKVAAIIEIARNLLRLVMRFIAKRDEPEAVRKREQNEVDKAIATGDEDSVNRLLDDRINRVRNKDTDRPE